MLVNNNMLEAGVLLIGLFIFLTLTLIAYGSKKLKYTIGILVLLLIAFLTPNGFYLHKLNSHHRLDGIRRIERTLVESKDPVTKEVVEVNFDKLALGHEIRRFYDVPKNGNQYVTWDENVFTRGNVQFHMFEN